MTASTYEGYGQPDKPVAWSARKYPHKRTCPNRRGALTGPMAPIHACIIIILLFLILQAVSH